MIARWHELRSLVRGILCSRRYIWGLSLDADRADVGGREFPDCITVQHYAGNIYCNKYC